MIYGIYRSYTWGRELSRLTEEGLHQRMQLVASQVDQAVSDETVTSLAALGRFSAELLPGETDSANDERVLEALRTVWQNAHGLPTLLFAFSCRESGIPKRPVFWRPAPIPPPVDADYAMAVERGWSSLLESSTPLEARGYRRIAAIRERSVLVLYHPAVVDGRVRGASGVLIDPEALSLDDVKGILLRQIPESSLRQLTLVIRNRDGSVQGSRSGLEDLPHPATEVRTPLKVSGVETPWTVALGIRGGSPRSFAARLRRRNDILTIATGLIFVASAGLLLVAFGREIRFLSSKTAFLANMSHELKTPLALIWLSADTVRLRRFEDSELVDRYCGFISEETARLTGIVERTLQFAQAEGGFQAYRFEPSDAGAIVRQALQIHEPMIAKLGASMRLEIAPDLPPIQADRGMLLQAVQNLIDNALKYSAPPPKIVVRVAAQDGFVSISVQDSGFGIPVEDRDRIFDPFVRAPRKAFAYPPGTGLGLSLVRQIVEAHGGRIDVESEPDRGSRFTLRFPAKSEAA
jgi:two-component system phosphate regulon sensor histidine kinase PhoR